MSEPLHSKLLAISRNVKSRNDKYCSSNHNDQVKPSTDDIGTTEDQGEMEADVKCARRRRESEDENSDNECTRDKRVKKMNWPSTKMLLLKQCAFSPNREIFSPQM